MFCRISISGQGRAGRGVIRLSQVFITRLKEQRFTCAELDALRPHPVVFLLPRRERQFLGIAKTVSTKNCKGTRRTCYRG